MKNLCEVIALIGKVVKVNYKRGLVIFEDEIGDYGYFEVLGTDFIFKYYQSAFIIYFYNFTNQSNHLT